MKIQKGKILVYTWGYDAHLATFYYVVSTTPKSAKLAKIENTVNTGSWHSGTAAVDTTKPLVLSKTIISKRIKGEGEGEYLSMDHGNARVWKGTPINTYNHH